MKKVTGMILAVAGVASFAFVGALVAVEPVAPQKATGDGHIHFGKDHEGLGYFVFEVSNQGGAVNGSFTFAGEHHHGYPDFVVQLDDVDQAKIGRRSARFSGKGYFHDQSVIISVTVRDGVDDGQADHLQLICKDGDGHVVFEAEGDLEDGDISVGTPS